MRSILILDAFITDDEDEKLLNNFLDSSKSFGDDVLLMTNTKISKETQDKVDFLFYDKKNQLFKEKYDNYEYVNYYTNYTNFNIYNWFQHTQPHGLSVLISLFRSVKIAKNLGYTHFYKMEYDALLGEETKNKIKVLNDSCLNDNKKGVFFIRKNKNYTGMAVHYFFCEIDYFLNNFWNISCEQDYVNFLQIEKNNKDFLIMERFMFENMEKLDSNSIEIKDNFDLYFSDTLWNSKATRVYLDKKYKECYTKFYINEDNPNQIIIFSNNLQSTPTFRKIVIKFSDGTETEIVQYFAVYGIWNLHSFENKIDKMMVYDDEGFLYEEYFESSTLNRIKFI
jgi:hypothetical protein